LNLASKAKKKLQQNLRVIAFKKVVPMKILKRKLEE